MIIFHFFLEDEKSCEDSVNFCEKISKTVSLGSSVLLPCNLRPNRSNWVTWSHAATRQAEMVQLSSQGHVKFLDPRNGRVKVFSNEQIDGNYSIRIDELEKSDLGCYRCRRQCVQVMEIRKWSFILSYVKYSILTAACRVSSFPGSQTSRPITREGTND